MTRDSNYSYTCVDNNEVEEKESKLIVGAGQLSSLHMLPEINPFGLRTPLCRQLNAPSLQRNGTQVGSGSASILLDSLNLSSISLS